MWTRLWNEAPAFAPPPASLVTESELSALPAAVRAWLAFYRVAAGQPRRWSMRVGWTGRFRRTPREPWMPIDAVQYNTRVPVSRTFHMKARMKSLPVLARDTYVGGHGRMLAKLAGFVTVADGTGPEFDAGECVTWVNDAILFAPTMLLGPATHWTDVDARTFEVAFSDAGRTVKARVSLDERGAPVDFETTDRFLEDPNLPGHPLVRGRWSTPVDPQAWRSLDGAPYPGRARALWHLQSGDFVYGEFEVAPGTLAFDEMPRGYPVRSSPAEPAQPSP